MSRKKIKKNLNKNSKKSEISLRYVAMSQLMEKRQEEKNKDSHKVSDMIVDGTLDPDKIEDYKHLLEVSKELSWSVGRLNKAIELAGVNKVAREQRSK